VLRIAEHFHDSDLGRQRRGNEDNLFVRAPLFVVADGMGGAQAGEVASELAVRSFEHGLPGGQPPASALSELIQAANTQIHATARADAERAGMGTTVTAAYLDDETVVVAHVGDSRCYLLREGDLVRLTRDHSLVGELVAQGKLTEEQAEAHPQRSVITRALGPEPSVEVDVEAFPARAGDLFLLCSDGLTGMVPEAKLATMLRDGDGLERTGRALIAAANAAGGRDNITVILFRIEEVGATRAHAAADTQVTTESPAAEYDDYEDEGSGPRQGVSRPTAAVALQEPPPRSTPLPPGRGTAGPDASSHPPRALRRRRRLLPLALLLGCVVVPLAIGAWLATRAVYFVGTDTQDERTVTIFRGLPYDLPLGVELYEPWYASGVTLQEVPPARRDALTDHRLRSRDDAEDLVIALEKGEVE